MKIAITGGSGFIGTELINELKKTNDSILILSRTNNMSIDRLNYIKTDYSENHLSSVLKNVDIVLHLAATRDIKNSFNKFISNINVTDNIFRAMVALGIKKLIFSSSISVYSQQEKLPWRESQITYPKNYYGLSKMTGECLADLFHQTNNINTISLRIAQIIGEGERRGYMMNTFIDNAFNKNKLTVIGKSIAKREYVYVKDVVRAIILALSKVSNYHGPINIGSNIIHTNLEYASYINDFFENIDNLEYNENIQESIQDSFFDKSLSKKILGYQANYDLHSALQNVKKIKENQITNSI
jgi:UDP-glucose 4-epimerase